MDSKQKVHRERGLTLEEDEESQLLPQVYQGNFKKISLPVSTIFRQKPRMNSGESSKRKIFKNTIPALELIETPDNQITTRNSPYLYPNSTDDHPECLDLDSQVT
jgi:hypothetical protein